MPPASFSAAHRMELTVMEDTHVVESIARALPIRLAPREGLLEATNLMPAEHGIGRGAPNVVGCELTRARRACAAT